MPPSTWSLPLGFCPQESQAPRDEQESLEQGKYALGDKDQIKGHVNTVDMHKSKGPDGTYS